MRAPLLAVLAALALALPLEALGTAPAAKQRTLTLLVTGDNRGEVAPCG